MVAAFAESLRTHDFSGLQLEEMIEIIKSEIRDEYLQDHSHPWVIGYSGGKDSTLVVHLVYEVLMDLPRSQRRREVHIVSNDTLVESPLVIGHIKESLERIRDAASVLRLPVVTSITTPNLDHTFWVNLIGRGYPSPNRTFRWCTDRMKIQPTSAYIKSQIEESKNVILLLGVRRSESATRAASVKRYDNGERLNRHNDLVGCAVFRPIVELSTDDVWEYLAEHDAPWGGNHQKLIQLYRDASGGECPIVTQKSDAPSCGSTSSRFGCWTCTVVDKDRSLEGFVDAGFAEFGPLLDFRDYLVAIRSDPNKRSARRRNGTITITDTGTFIPGPFTLETRHEILDRLIDLQRNQPVDLISAEEIDRIRQIWSDEITASPKGERAVTNTLKKVR
ncbi:DNA phosphorothioation system sulfurtransferase DndC [Rhizobium sp. YTUHZ044]|uniref:DNA phosphorothioation system sulfurtransferase DndC n=1 Tax=Rhizobium sp. YTUHZ044 TaxID=2962678 RepID=UPI003DA9B416